MKHVPCSDWNGVTHHRYAHLKRDGIWVTLQRDQSGEVSTWSRTPRRLSLDWHPAVQRFTELAPKSTVVFCELFVPDGNRELVKGMIRDHDDKLALECFAVQQYEGDWPWTGCHLEIIQAKAESLGMTFVPWHFMREVEDLRAIPAGGEGWMLKDGNTLNWKKVKPRITVDLICVRFERGLGKFSGQIGAMVLADATGKEVTQVSGMTDEIRAHMTAYPEMYLGKVIEVEAQARGSAGGLMHPRYNCVRDDKLISEVDTL